MKVLFVCQANANRSQIAEALFNSLSSHQAHSAGTRAGEILEISVPPTPRLTDAPPLIQILLRCMREEEGIDMSQQVRKQLTQKMVEDADKVIMIAERNNWPEYVVETDSKVVVWDIHDPVRDVGSYPDDEDDAYTLVREAKNKIKNLVQELVREIG